MTIQGKVLLILILFIFVTVEDILLTMLQTWQEYTKECQYVADLWKSQCNIHFLCWTFSEFSRKQGSWLLYWSLIVLWYIDRSVQLLIQVGYVASICRKERKRLYQMACKARCFSELIFWYRECTFCTKWRFWAPAVWWNADLYSYVLMCMLDNSNSLH